MTFFSLKILTWNLLPMRLKLFVRTNYYDSKLYIGKIILMLILQCIYSIIYY